MNYLKKLIPMDEEKYFSLIKSLIKRKKNIDLNGYRKNYLLRRFRVRMAKTRCEEISEYYSLLLRDDEEVQKLIDTIGINVSRFYRDKDVFNAIYNKVLPYLKDRFGFIKGWSAGCAGGEEAYTLAILFFDFSIKNFKIIGTDFDREVIEVAKEGVFESKSFEELPLRLRVKYIKKENNSSFSIKNIIKKYVEFKIHNLLAEPVDKDFDIILCRNVLIYMKRDAQEKVFENLTSALKKDGILVLGKVEMLHHKFEKFYIPVDLREKIFRKII